MAIENIEPPTPAYVDDLDKNLPDGSNTEVNELDNHIRGIKNVFVSCFAAITGAVTATHEELNKLAGKLGAVCHLGEVGAFTKQQTFTEVALTEGANVSWNLDDAQCAVLTLTADAQLDNPTNMKAGGSYVLRVVTGGNELTFDTAFVWEGGVAPAVNSGTCLLTFYSTGTSMIGSALVGIA